MNPSLLLVSLVVILKYEQIVPYGEFSGRRAERFFFDMVRVTNPKLVTWAHDNQTAGLYVVSQLYYMQDNTYWMRVATVDEQIQQALEYFTDPYVFDTWQLLDVKQSDHEWAQQETIQDIIQHIWSQHPSTNLFIDIASPTSVKSQGVYRPFPDPILLFRSLYERWHKLRLQVSQYTPPSDMWELFIQHYIAFIACPNLKIITVDHKRGEPVVAFTGTIHLQLWANNPSLRQTAQRRFDNYDATLHDKLHHIDNYKHDLYRWVHLLTRLGFYSGVGVKTGWGMGMIRAIDRFNET